MKPDQPFTNNDSRQKLRALLIDTATNLLASSGAEGVTTRSVATAANVQPPTIYRLFGDKDALLDAVAEDAFYKYAITKSTHEAADPIDDLRAGWDLHIDFGLANPHLFTIMAEPRRAAQSSAAGIGKDVLAARIRRIAAAGKLKVSEQLAVDLTQATGIGIIFTLLAKPEQYRDRSLADVAFQTLLEAITTETAPQKETDLIVAANTMHAHVSGLEGVLTLSEMSLFTEWLDRITNTQS